ncbi:SxtJ family membrane protein [Alishewanella jeotgali]|uniref:SxtJ n=1 Tax=Alishewanella jeotgali KCTC 22429 TaxID=1129374 RepID=H3ZDY8_9ALTE|nr:SxtJ family membrane protein [Alishewanella jeotgali]EHR41165.1 hypothetical protein AJE_07850 [Alishewanella jeotgali KCTC 22429]
MSALLLKKTDHKGLRQFGLQMALVIPMLFGLLLPWLFGWFWSLWPWMVATGFLLLALVYAPGLYYPYRVWMAFAAVMGWLNTRLLLGVVFYLLIMPLGLLLRLCGKLQYQAHPKGDSFWRQPDKEPTAKDLEDPF